MNKRSAKSVIRPLALALTLSTALWVVTGAAALAVEGYDINAGGDYSGIAPAPQQRPRFVNLSGPGNVAPLRTYPVAPQAPTRMMPATSAIAPAAVSAAMPPSTTTYVAMPVPPASPARARPLQTPLSAPRMAPTRYPAGTPPTRLISPPPTSAALNIPAAPLVSAASAAPATSGPALIPPPPAVAGTETLVPEAKSPALTPPLSAESKQILSSAQPPLSQRMAEKATKVDIRNVDPEISEVIKRAEQTYESSGVKISVASAPIDEQRELQRAYDVLMEGETGEAIRIYRDVLRFNPRSEDALFGLAATYHRNGQVENARPLYGQLLKINPSHREALNNMMALAAGEAPQEALDELAQLERRFPDYSPIPAQMALIFDKLGQPDMARSKMTRAIALSPENWVYKYNFAIMLDRQGALPDAAALYRDILAAGVQGEKIPVDTHALQERLNFIAARLG